MGFFEFCWDLDPKWKSRRSPKWTSVYTCKTWNFVFSVSFNFKRIVVVISAFYALWTLLMEKHQKRRKNNVNSIKLSWSWEKCSEGSKCHLHLLMGPYVMFRWLSHPQNQIRPSNFSSNDIFVNCAELIGLIFKTVWKPCLVMGIFKKGRQFTSPMCLFSGSAISEFSGEYWKYLSEIRRGMLDCFFCPLLLKLPFVKDIFC